MQPGIRVQGMLVLLIAGSLSGCGAAPVSQPDAPHQQQALQRWVSCIQRQSVQVLPVHRLDGMIKAHCEDYHRDVLNAFPLHLENHLRRLLSERTSEIVTQQLVKTNSSDSWIGSQGTQIDTLKRLLLKTRQDNL